MDAARKTYSTASTVLGWIIAALFFIHSVFLVIGIRTDKSLPLREEMRGWHYLIGTLLFVTLVLRLYHWRKDGKVAPPQGLSAGAHHWGRTLTLTTYILLTIAPVLGYLYGWSDGLRIHMADLFDVPALIPENYRTWMFTGYFHSGMGFMTNVLDVAAILTAGYIWLRYTKSPLAAFPPGYGAMILLTLGVTVYASTTFRSPEPGPRAVAIYVGILLAFWALGKVIGRKRQGRSFSPLTSGAVTVAAPIAALALIGLGSYGPHAMFKVTPWPMGEAIEAPAGVSSHDAPLMRVKVTPSSPFELAVKAETYKWCVFCHTMNKGGEHRVGPNLYAIFGQRAGTVPNFHYTAELAEAGRKGLIWTDETIAAYIADPQNYIKGTSMIISSGPIPDPKVQKAIVNLLKRDTMPGSIDE